MKILFITFFCIISLNAQDIENTIPGDPFTSFDDEETAFEEENLERFFSFGRFLHLSLYGSTVMPMGPMSEIYTAGFGAGGSITYFIDWNIAITFDVSLNILPIDMVLNDYPEGIQGSAYLSATNVYLKYYFNFFDISKFIAKLNPYFKLGAGLYILSDNIDVNETITDIGFSPARTAIAPGIVVGLGIEYNLYKKMFLLSLDANYHYTMFSPTNPNVEGTGIPDLEFFDYSGSILSIGCSLILNFN